MAYPKRPKRSSTSSDPSLPKKPKPPFNVKTQIRSALRQAWRMHPVLQEVLKRDRLERPFVKKDGTISSKPRIFFECYVCKTECPRKEVNIDHVNPVGPTPGSKLAPPELDWNTFIDRMFTTADNLAPICHACHHAKTQREGAERRAAMRGMDDASEPKAS